MDGTLDLQQLLKECKKKRYICPHFEKGETVVEQDGATYKVVIFVEKKRKGKSKETINTQQSVIEYYKRVIGIKEDDANANVLFSRFGKAAREMLKRTDNDVIRCFKAIEHTADWCAERDLLWNLDTVIKRWYEAATALDTVKLKYLTKQEEGILKGREQDEKRDKS